MPVLYTVAPLGTLCISHTVDGRFVDRPLPDRIVPCSLSMLSLGAAYT